MKKAILVLLVGLFWCNVGFAEKNTHQFLLDNKLVVLYEGEDWRIQFLPNNKITDEFRGKTSYKFSWKKLNDRGLYEVRHSDTDFLMLWEINLNNQTMTETNTNRNETYTYQIKTPSSNSSSGSTDDKIAQAKQICKDLGFKTNTEKFADCSLKMLSMQFEVQNRESSSDGGTQQKIVVNQGYSVGDAMIALSGIISDANNVRSSYGGGNCRIFQHAYHASLKCN